MKELNAFLMNSTSWMVLSQLAIMAKLYPKPQPIVKDIWFNPNPVNRPTYEIVRSS